MEVIDERVRQRRENHFYYREHLEQIEGISFLNEPGDDYFSNHWLTTMLVDPEKTGTSNHLLMEEMANRNIESRYLWKPMHLQPVFSSYPAYLNGTSERLFQQGLCLPSGSNMSEDDRDRVMDVLRYKFNI
jgi:dTDP-4-amino-4,6-dideoxygalactose transaminase